MERSETPANLPKNVEEAAGIFRVGEDAELAYRLQEQGLQCIPFYYDNKNFLICAFLYDLFYFFDSEYVDVQQFNENERKIVAHDIRLAKQVQVNSTGNNKALKHLISVARRRPSTKAGLHSGLCKERNRPKRFRSCKRAPRSGSKPICEAQAK